jgi:Beta-galactosidase
MHSWTRGLKDRSVKYHRGEAVDRMADHAGARFRSDPYLIGYFVDNELAWGRGSSTDPHQRYSIAVGILAAGPQSPAKSAFIEELSERYREPQRLAEAWGIPLTTWDDLRRAGFALPQDSFVKPAVIADLAAFTRRFSEAYFRTVAEALRRHDPDHLYLGSRFAWQTPEAVEACAHSCDVVSFNRYRRSIAGDEEWRRFHALGKPALIGEFHFGSTDRGLFWEGLVGVGSESERGPAYARSARGRRQSRFRRCPLVQICRRAADRPPGRRKRPHRVRLGRGPTL